MYDLCFKGGSVYVGGVFMHTNLYTYGENIEVLSTQVLPAAQTVDCTGLMILPGLIDPHVHLALNLGNITSCDDFASGSEAALRGGITTIIDFLDPIFSENELENAFSNRIALAKNASIDYAMHATLAAFTGDVSRLVDGAKVLGIGSIKVFTTYAQSKRKIAPDIIRQLLASDVITMVHAEDDVLVDPFCESIPSYAASRPLESELSALCQLISYPRKGHLYVVHVSSGSGVSILNREKGVIIESCPHYFILDESVYTGKEAGLYLMAPPLRNKGEVTKLRGLIDSVAVIGTDHCPFKRADKLASANASHVPKGVGGLTYSFLLMYNLFGNRIIDKMSQNPATVFGLKRKGQIAPGFDADLVVFDPAGHTNVSSHVGGSDYSVYEGLTLKGRIQKVFLRGQLALDNGKVIGTEGRYIRSDYHEGSR